MKQENDSINTSQSLKSKMEEYLFLRYNDVKEKERRDKEILLERFKLSTKGKSVVIESSNYKC